MFTMPSSLAPLRDIMNMIRRSDIGRYKDGAIFVYVSPKGAISPVDQPADEHTAEIVRWLDRQGRITWRTGPHRDHARLTKPAERVRARWQSRYPDDKSKAIDQLTRDTMRRIGVPNVDRPPLLRMQPTPLGDEDQNPRRLRLVRETAGHRRK